MANTWFILVPCCKSEGTVAWNRSIPSIRYGIQWNLFIKVTLNKGLLCNDDTACSLNHIELCTNLPLNYFRGTSYTIQDSQLVPSGGLYREVSLHALTGTYAAWPQTVDAFLWCTCPEESQGKVGFTLCTWLYVYTHTHTHTHKSTSELL